MWGSDEYCDTINKQCVSASGIARQACAALADRLSRLLVDAEDSS